MCVREKSFGSALYSVFHSLLDDIMTAETVNNSRYSRGLASKIYLRMCPSHHGRPKKEQPAQSFQPLFLEWHCQKCYNEKHLPDFTFTHVVCSVCCVCKEGSYSK